MRRMTLGLAALLVFLAVVMRAPTVARACAPSNADMNSDGRVNILDLSLVAAHFQQPATGPYAPLGYGYTTILDLAYVASYYTQFTC